MTVPATFTVALANETATAHLMADLALLVVDAFQGFGVGRTLLSRLAGAAQGQLSLAEGEAGRLSLADGEAGRLSFPDPKPPPVSQSRS